MATAKENKTQDKPSFESTMESLENLLVKLESNETSLENSLEAFESGIKLTREAQKSLLEAEQRVQLLTQQDDGPLSTPFQDESDK
jgi:exodeoxyribonuclease VII small subunit